MARSAALWTARAFVLLDVAYVIEIGGDFLDLYRFFVPLFPMLFVTFTAAAARAFDRYSASNAVRLVVGVLAFVPHASKQLSLGARALAVQDVSRAKLGIEPIGWTKRAAVEWSLVGAWLKGAALPGDTLATGAAGAMPFFSGLPNFDLLGSAAPEVARSGKRLGIRPGHARYATWEQIKAHNPAFLYIEWRPGERAGWEERGYVWIRVRTDGFLTTLRSRRPRRARAPAPRRGAAAQVAMDRARLPLRLVACFSLRLCGRGARHRVAPPRLSLRRRMDGGRRLDAGGAPRAGASAVAAERHLRSCTCIRRSIRGSSRPLAT